MRIGYGIGNGTFGELVQGVYNKQPFLITMPIPVLTSKAVFIPNETKTIIGHSSYSKAVLACNKLISLFNRNVGGTIYLASNIPRGKGMASSSADLVAAMKAVAEGCFLDVNNEILSTIATEIEPTDGVMYENVVAYNYKNGSLMESFGNLPPFDLIGIDIGGYIDTIQFNQQRKTYSRHDLKAFHHAFHLIRTGIQSQNLSSICQASTISAKINEKILPKKYFDEMEKLAASCQGGVVVAHSGTMIGILLDHDHPNRNDCLLRFKKLVDHTKAVPFYYSHKKLAVRDKNLHFNVR
ncbi:GHMP family kinase ATP-binding protein [Metabacillus litoralis]|uniref:GHMP family kinase ATP-binding protein n=1 Tax=Metabacillus litoralis TaxID=152268 RepID=UPI000EF6290F|nr:hypothetical protein [Metabacillus litoralis]